MRNDRPALLREGNIANRDVLSATEFVAFAKPRSPRKEIVECEGLPPSALFANEKLAAMGLQQVRTKHDRMDRCPREILVRHPLPEAAS